MSITAVSYNYLLPEGMKFKIHSGCRDFFR